MLNRLWSLVLLPAFSKKCAVDNNSKKCQTVTDPIEIGFAFQIKCQTVTDPIEIGFSCQIKCLTVTDPKN